MADRWDAVVIGAGVVGVTTAYALARQGLSVLIVDGAREPARGTSFANGAQLSYAYTEPLASPALLPILPLLALGRDPAFRLRPSCDPDFIKWGLAFLRNCTELRFRTNMLEGLKLGLESRRAMYGLLARHPIEFGHVAAGKLHLLEGKTAVEAAAKVVALKRKAGVVQFLLTPQEASSMEPALADKADELSAVIYSPQEEIGDPYRFCLGLTSVLTRDYGVETRFGTAVTKLSFGDAQHEVETGEGERIEARHLAICTGVDTPELLRGTGIKVPIWPMKGYSLTAPCGPQAPSHSITDVARKLVFCRLLGQVRVAGLADLGSRDTRINPARIASLVSSAKASLPLAADYRHIRSTWSGLRPMTPSSLPVIRRERRGVVLNVGHGTLGWTFAMGAAERAAELMVAKP